MGISIYKGPLVSLASMAKPTRSLAGVPVVAGFTERVVDWVSAAALRPAAIMRPLSALEGLEALPPLRRQWLVVQASLEYVSFMSLSSDGGIS